MYNFRNDYSEGCHPRILEALTRTNLEATPGYGLDPHCAAAADRIRQVTGCPEADVHFLVGGTQANATAIAAFLRPHEAPICVSSGHINTHETGAVEATGHKILTKPAADGKITPAMIEQILSEQPDEHVVYPKLVYLSQATELGTVYTKAELTAVSQCCRAHGLYLFLDGARLAAGLAASDLTMADLPQLCDCFYIGGTKNGALFGEALVIVTPELKPFFRWHIKQRGGMLAKGRLLGIQFEELLRDELYLELGRHSTGLAQKLQSGLKELGVPMMVESPTNQIFPVVENRLLKPLEELCTYEVWGPMDETHSAIRFVTSWATQESVVSSFLTEFQGLLVSEPE